MKGTFTAVYKKEGKWYSAWVEEVPGVNTQGKTLKEARENLAEALELILSTNKLLQEQTFRKDKVIKESLEISLA